VRARLIWIGSLLLLIGLLDGCVSATRMVKNEAAPTKEYDGDLYFLAFKRDPRSVQPRAIKELEAMGFNVRVVDRDHPISGSQGTGFVISPDGHVLTCAHVIGAEKVATIWVSKVRYEADVIGLDKESDLALLKTRTPITPAVTPLSFKRDGRYQIGADVATIGYPLGGILGTSVRYTKGTLSATAGIHDDPGHLQISAAVQPGNSGGPLLDGEGVVIGVVRASLNAQRTAEATGGHLPQNVNFALKADRALQYLSAHKAVYDALVYDRPTGLDRLQESVVRVRSGNITDEWEKKPKLLVRVDYRSIWDVWFRFRLFVVRVYDLDTRQLLIVAGQGRDNMISNEDVVIRDTFAQVRQALHKDPR